MDQGHTITETVPSPSGTGMRERILDAGAAVLERRATATLTDVAVESASVKSTVHHYFKNKMMFVRAVYKAHRNAAARKFIATRALKDVCTRIGLELTALTMSREDSELRTIVAESWAAERVRLPGNNAEAQMLIQAAVVGVRLNTMLDYTTEEVGLRALAMLEALLAKKT